MKRYLFYDNIIKGAGIGHTLACYAYGLNLSRQKGINFLADRMILGHGVKNLEEFLGLKDFRQERERLLKSNKELIFFNNYKMGEHPAIPILSWPRNVKKYFYDRYHKHRKVANSHIQKGCFNIAVAIRRGDIINNPNLKDRVLPDSYYRERVNCVLNKLNPSSYRINIYSDGAQNSNSYINEDGKKTSLKKILPELHSEARLYLGEYKHEKTFEMIQNCVQSDYFIGSKSGLSKLIMIYREGVNCEIPR